MNIGYLQQSYQQRQNQTNMLNPIYDLKVGENGLGIPWYMLWKLSAAIYADNLALINNGDTYGFGFTVFNQNTGSSPADIWKVTNFNDVDNLLRAGTQIMCNGNPFDLVTPTPIPIGGRVFDDSFDSVFA